MGLTRMHVVILLSITIVCLIGSRFLFDRNISVNLSRTFNDNDITASMNKVKQQRNNLSRALNLKQQKIGQMECEEMMKKKDIHKVSSTGGWCANTSIENSGHHKTDKKLAPVLADFFKGKYIASFGDGPGRYKQLLTDSGLLKGYDAYDGAPFSEKTSEGRVKYLDLTLPQFGLPLYDWVMSLEVAEHIPKDYESIYLDNIVRHAKEGVVISWAKLGQDGYSHVNNRPFEYVKNTFDKLGFDHDLESSKKIQKAATLEWLQWNTNVYRRRGDLTNIESILRDDT